MIAVAAIAIAGLTAGSAVADTAPTTTPPPAPAGFASSLTSLYATLYGTVQTLDGKTGRSRAHQVPDPSRFAQDISRLSPTDLALLHEATVRQGNWDALAPDSQQLLAGARSAPSAASAAAGRTQPGGATAGRSAPAATPAPAPAAPHSAIAAQDATGGPPSFPPDEPLGDFPGPLATFEPTMPVEPLIPITCAANGNPYPYYVASDTAIFIGKTVATAADAAYEIIPTLAPAFVGESYESPLKIVAAVIVGVANLAVSALEDAQASAEDCDLVNETAYDANTENAAVNSFELETRNEETIGAIESSVNTIHDQVHVAQQSFADGLTTEIQQALALPATAPADVYYELPTAVGGNLDSTPIGVQAVVTNAYNAAKQAGLPVNATATSNLTAANQALVAHNYKTAWKDYQAAYQALG
jgi:hypothetical protein